MSDLSTCYAAVDTTAMAYHDNSAAASLTQQRTLICNHDKDHSTITSGRSKTIEE